MSCSSGSLLVEVWRLERLQNRPIGNDTTPVASTYGHRVAMKGPRIVTAVGDTSTGIERVLKFTAVTPGGA